jgi:hypothetical protein
MGWRDTITKGDSRALLFLIKDECANYTSAQGLAWKGFWPIYGESILSLSMQQVYNHLCKKKVDLPQDKDFARDLYNLGLILYTFEQKMQKEGRDEEIHTEYHKALALLKLVEGREQEVHAQYQEAFALIASEEILDKDRDVSRKLLEKMVMQYTAKSHPILGEYTGFAFPGFEFPYFTEGTKIKITYTDKSTLEIIAHFDAEASDSDHRDADSDLVDPQVEAMGGDNDISTD